MDVATRRWIRRLDWTARLRASKAAVTTYPDLVVCEECDAVHTRRELQTGEVARCIRCGSKMGVGHVIAFDGQLALALGALIVFIIGNVSPIVTLDLRGLRSTATLHEAIRSTWDAGEHLVAVLAGATTFAFPLTVIVLRLWVLLPLAWGRRAKVLIPAMRALRWVTRWSMVEVFMLGTLIAIVRSAGLASVILGAGIFSFAALTILLAAVQASGLHDLWHRASELPQ